MFPMSKKVCNVAIAAAALATASLAASGDALAIQCVKAPCQLPSIKPAVPAILTKPAVPAIFTKPAPIQVITPARLPATTTSPQPPKVEFNIQIGSRPPPLTRPSLDTRPERPLQRPLVIPRPLLYGNGPDKDTLAARQAQAEAERAAAAARAAAAEAKRLSRPKVIYVGSPAPVAPAPVAAPAPIAAPAPAPTCLTKEYLQAGTVLFKDVCTNQFAMNSTTLPSQVVTAATRACLTKENLQAGVVLFKDTCTNEWAMNPPEQQAQAPQTPAVPQVR